MSQLSKPLYERLVGAKYIFYHGIDTLERAGPFSAGMAILAFQDSVEMMLRVIADHLHIGINKQATFHTILDQIDGHGEKKLTHRDQLNKLNGARVQFKHLGTEPRTSDVKNFRSNLESFFPNVLSNFLGLDFRTLSLADLILYRRAKNWIKKAEDLLESGEYDESSRCSATAYKLAKRKYPLEKDSEDLTSSLRMSGDQDAEAIFSNFAEMIEKRLSSMQELLDVATDGLSLTEYQKFKRLTPGVVIMASGCVNSLSSAGRRPVSDFETALFCINFSIDAILRMQSRDIPLWFKLPKTDEGELSVTLPASIIVWPKDNPEEIRSSDAGEIIKIRGERFNKEGYTAIWDDDEMAFIKSNALQAINTNY